MTRLVSRIPLVAPFVEVLLAQSLVRTLLERQFRLVLAPFQALPHLSDRADRGHFSLEFGQS